MAAAPVLEFERPLAELEKQIEELKRLASDSALDVEQELVPLQQKLSELRVEIYRTLTPLQRVQVARIARRPFTSDYIRLAFTDFIELHGDRLFREDAAILAGWARLEGETVMIIGHERGRDTKENLRRNFGMPHPEGYRKALRLMKLAEKFGVPIAVFIDTPGAYPGVGSEQRGQAEAIARNLLEMSRLRTPVVCVVIGEGGSGGALGIGVGFEVPNVGSHRELHVHVQGVTLGHVERVIGSTGRAVDLTLLGVVDVLDEPGHAQYVFSHALAPLTTRLRIGDGSAQCLS